MSHIETSGPAFPMPGMTGLPNDGFVYGTDGMTLRQYAAIKLRVPESGTDWLDAMIVQSRRDELAESAVLGLLSDTEVKGTREEFASRAYQMADAMIAAGKGGAK